MKTNLYYICSTLKYQSAQELKVDAPKSVLKMERKKLVANTMVK